MMHSILILIWIVALSCGYGLADRNTVVGRGHPQHRHDPYRQPNDDRNAYHSTACCINRKTFTTPVLDTLLFPPDVCPIKSPKAVCEAAGRRFGMPESSLYPLHFETVYRDTYSSYGATILIEKPADVAVVGVGCCYNVYPEVRPGDQLSAQCENPVFGDYRALLQDWSISTPGSIDYVHKMRVMGSTFVGSDWLGVEGMSLRGDYVLIGGCIAPGRGIVVTSPDKVQVVEPTERLERYTVISERSAEVIKGSLSYQTCQLSQTFLMSRPNGEVDIDISETTVRITFTCAVGAQECTINVPPIPVLSSQSVRINFDVGSATSVQINWAGKVIAFAVFFDVDSGNLPPAVYNYFEADTIKFVISGQFVGSVLAPLATEVTMEGGSGYAGSLLLGNKDSLLRIGTFPEMSITLNHFEAPEPPETNIVLCNCICKEDRHHYDG